MPVGIPSHIGEMTIIERQRNADVWAGTLTLATAIALALAKFQHCAKMAPGLGSLPTPFV